MTTKRYIALAVFSVVQHRLQCAQFKNTYYTFDAGRIRMGVFLAKDGALFVQFAPPQ